MFIYYKGTSFLRFSKFKNDYFFNNKEYTEKWIKENVVMRIVYNEQKRVTRKGTEKSVRQPWKIEITTKSFPHDWVIMGSVVSAVVAPPTDIGASLPKYFTRTGANSKAIISLIILDKSAMVPNSAPRYSVIIILDSE